ncbi:hypothetical protein CDL12_06073 [Handroanthus impetiginosus]|uniref:MACPF domain-containing protein n=1 Tax=Handroanthus impetiginosus TaxID=429701 RepID=A0A2G9HUN4_9LAMI|nr:hypothetical protein CDL12_06073 [Handroanthus impetiginosus]
MDNEVVAPLPRQIAMAEAAVKSIGLGFDMVMDCRLEYCKNPDGRRLLDFDHDHVRDLAVPGGISVPNVPECIKCGKGERTRFHSDILSFQQMSEQFNQDICGDVGKIPTGHFNAAFEFTSQWQNDAADTRGLAFDGVFITLYSIEVERSQILLADHVKQAVPPTWDPITLAKFITKYGTHIITGVRVGGKDAVYVKQRHSSPLQDIDLQKILKDVSEKRFSDARGMSSNDTAKTFNEAMLDRIEHGLTFMDSSTLSIYSHKEEITFFWRRRGGSSSKSISHEKWCLSVKLEPEVISMTFVPILSLLRGIPGKGFLSHAINLYLRYKPPLEALHQFLEFQAGRKWAPEHGELTLVPERKQPSDACLRFSFLGPKLYVNTDLVDVGGLPVTGARLYLEGRRSNCLAIHLQHLLSSPGSFQLLNDSTNKSSTFFDKRYHEKVRWKTFSHVCTAPVESNDELSVVTGAQFQVKKSGVQDVLFLLLQFSRVTGAVVLRRQEWDCFEKSQSGFFSFIGGQKHARKPSEVNINSAVCRDGPPSPVAVPQFLRFVDTKEFMRGPQDHPGYWVVSGARLVIDKGKISHSIKYSLLEVVG